MTHYPAELQNGQCCHGEVTADPRQLSNPWFPDCTFRRSP